MRLSRKIFFSLACILIFFTEAVYASIDITITPLPILSVWDFVDITKYEDDLNERPAEIIKNNKDVMPYGLAMGNTLGYPSGKAIIPNFEAGFAVGGAVHYLDKYKNLKKEDNTEYPGVGANAAIHFGFGLSEDTDITFKFIINQNMYSPDKSINNKTDTGELNFSVNETNIFSAGIKGRYNIIAPKSIIPFIFSFGGLTAGISLDYTHGKLSFKNTYTDTQQISFTGYDIFNPSDTFTQDINLLASVSGVTEFEWNIVSVTPDILGYIDLFYFLTLYTGPAVSFNAGSANLSLRADGSITNLNPIYRDSGNSFILIDANETIATATLRANEPMKVPIAIPLWKVGIELNIAAFKLTVEAAAVLTDITNSFTAQAGARLHF